MEVGCLPYSSRWPQPLFALLSPLKRARHSASWPVVACHSIMRHDSLLVIKDCRHTPFTAQYTVLWASCHASKGALWRSGHRGVTTTTFVGGSGCFVSEQAKLTCPRPRLCAIVHPQFAENVTHMAFDGLDGNHQCLRNLIVGGAS